MRSLFWLITLLILAVSLALFMQFNQSNVAFFYPPYRIDLSLNLFLVLWFASIIVFYMGLRTFLTLLNLPARAVKYRRHRQMEHANEALQNAWIQLNAGRFSRAEKFAEVAQAWPEYKEIAALMGAHAAHNLNEIKRRDDWLNQIQTSELQQAKWVAMAEMQLESRDPEGALTTIAQLQEQGGKQIQVYKIALRAHQQLKNYMEVLRLLRLLEKRNVLHPAVVNGLKQQACAGLLKERCHDVQALNVFWRSLGLKERTLAYNANLAARLFIDSGYHVLAQSVLEQALNNNWEPHLLLPYADCVAPEASALPLIGQVEKWLRTYPAEVMLYYTLGRLCWHQRLWGKAQSSLENVLMSVNEKEALARLTHITLAQLHENLENKDLAYQHYRAAALFDNHKK